jgi:hypothetical protein
LHLGSFKSPSSFKRGWQEYKLQLRPHNVAVGLQT